MRILVAGSTGLIGSALVSYLKKEGHSVSRLVRAHTSSSNGSIFWDPYGRIVEMNALEGFDAVINLAGENLASGRWTESKKKDIRDSRVQVTKYLCDLLSKLKQPPKVLVNASAIGYYGDTGNSPVSESTPAGDGFLASVCREWEEATVVARDNGIRVVNIRIGVVIAREGGLVSRLLLPFKLGIGGVIGSGNQFMSWICIDDLVRLIAFVIENPKAEGPINAVSPQPITNKTFTEVLGKALGRPTFIPFPAFAARMVFGQMADEIMLFSSRVMPVKLQNLGYQFTFPELEPAIKKVLMKKGPQD